MRDDQIHQWLKDHLPTTNQFMDYSPHARPSSLDRNLGMWFNNHGWNDDGRSVTSLGFDSMGGEFVHWGRPGADAVVVYFGSEGGFGVLAPSLVDWVRAIAQGPTILEHGPPATLFVSKTRPPHGAKSLRDFQSIAEQRFGPGSGPHDLTELNAEFSAWVEARRQTFSIRT